MDTPWIVVDVCVQQYAMPAFRAHPVSPLATLEAYITYYGIFGTLATRQRLCLSRLVEVLGTWQWRTEEKLDDASCVAGMVK